MSKKMTGYPSIDKPWLKYYSEEALGAELSKMTCYEYLVSCNKGAETQNIINYFGANITFGSLLSKIDDIAKSFVALGVKKGEFVSICMPTTVETITCFYALNKIGAIPDMLDPRANKEQLKYYLENNNSKVLILFSACIPKIKDIVNETELKKIVYLGPSESMPYLLKILYELKNKTPGIESDKYISWTEFNEQKKDTIYAKYEENTPAIMVHSSGTTGKPKGILLSNDNMNALAFQYSISPLKLHRGDRFLSAIPAFAAFGMVASVHLPLTLGLYTIVQPSVTVESFVNIVKKYKPRHCLTVPQNYDVLTKDKRIKDLSFFHSLGCGGDAVNSSIETRIANDLIDKNSDGILLKGWGMSELSSTACLEMDNCHDIGTVGIPLVKNTIAIFNPDTMEELEYNEKGEVCVCGPNVMLGYYRNEELTNKVLRKHADGKVWLHSGDIGHMDDEGKLYIDGRISRMIIRFDGFKIYPPAIEDVVSTHEGVKACAVVGIKDKEIGRVPIVYVELTDNYSGDIKTEVLSLCKEKLAERAVPYDVRVIDSIPMTLMGKVDFIALENM